jgi:hypothetical protein
MNSETEPHDHNRPGFQKERWQTTGSKLHNTTSAAILVTAKEAQHTRGHYSEH